MRAGFLYGFQDLRSAEELRGVGTGHIASREQGDVNGGSGNALGEVAEEQDVEGIEGKKSGEDLPVKRFNGGTNDFKTILSVLKNTGPSRAGVTDLVAKVGHEVSF